MENPQQNERRFNCKITLHLWCVVQVGGFCLKKVRRMNYEKRTKKNNSSIVGNINSI